jgi:hypothetical protein
MTLQGGKIENFKFKILVDGEGGRKGAPRIFYKVKKYAEHDITLFKNIFYPEY